MTRILSALTVDRAALRSSLTIVDLATKRFSARNAFAPFQTRSYATQEEMLKGMNGHKAIYRLLLPPMLHCLAIGSITFYALELWRTRLYNERQVSFRVLLVLMVLQGVK